MVLYVRWAVLCILAAPEDHVQLHHRLALALALLDPHLRHSQRRHLGRGEMCSGRGGGKRAEERGEGRRVVRHVSPSERKIGV